MIGVPRWLLLVLGAQVVHPGDVIQPLGDGLLIVPPFVKCLKTLRTDSRQRCDTGELFARRAAVDAFPYAVDPGAVAHSTSPGCA